MLCRWHLLFLLLIHATISVQAHGYVGKIEIGSETYTGNHPGGSPSEESIIHHISTIDPVLGAQNPDGNCGRDAQLAPLVSRDVQPGSTVKVFWTGGGGQRWPHNTGPMLTYLAKCDGDCASFDTTKARWFKINQIGWRNGEWVQAQFMDAKPHTFTFPSNIAPGGYILRHEVIALHNAVSRGGAEFYPSCANLNVGGSGSGEPEESELVSMPGAYDDDDPGIFIPTVYDGDQSDYPFPGPKIAAFVSSPEGNGDGEGDGDSGTSSATSDQATSVSEPTGVLETTGAARPTGVANTFVGQCRLSTRSSSDPSNYNRRRHFLGRWVRGIFGTKSQG